MACVTQFCGKFRCWMCLQLHTRFSIPRFDNFWREQTYGFFQKLIILIINFDIFLRNETCGYWITEFFQTEVKTDIGVIVSNKSLEATAKSIKIIRQWKRTGRAKAEPMAGAGWGTMS